MKRHLLIAIDAGGLTCGECQYIDTWRDSYGHHAECRLVRVRWTPGSPDPSRLPECLAAEASATTNEQLREMLEQAKRGSAKLAELRDKYGLDDGKEPQR